MKMIGDVLTSSILFEALRKNYPQARMDYLVYDHTQPVIANNPNIDNLIIFKPEEHKSIKGLRKLIGIVRKEKYKVVIDVYSKINSALITALSGSGTRVSYKKWYTQLAYTYTFPYKNKAETAAGLAVENRMQLLRAVDSDFPVEIKPKIYPTEEEIRWAKEKLRSANIELSRPLFMIGILGSGPEKTYPHEYMAAILDYIVREINASLLINYIPKQREEVFQILNKCDEQTRASINTEVFGKSLREFIALCSQCNALIGNEGGAINMAKALNIPTFSIFAPQTPKKEWAIYEDNPDNYSVHLEDYLSDFYSSMNMEEIKKDSEKLYLWFKPDLFLDKLKAFLKKFE